VGAGAGRQYRLTDRAVQCECGWARGQADSTGRQIGQCNVSVGGRAGNKCVSTQGMRRESEASKSSRQVCDVMTMTVPGLWQVMLYIGPYAYIGRHATAIWSQHTHLTVGQSQGSWLSQSPAGRACCAAQHTCAPPPLHHTADPDTPAGELWRCCLACAGLWLLLLPLLLVSLGHQSSRLRAVWLCSPGQLRTPARALVLPCSARCASVECLSRAAVTAVGLQVLLLCTACEQLPSLLPAAGCPRGV
jgi:hypothetical protein